MVNTKGWLKAYITNLEPKFCKKTKPSYDTFRKYQNRIEGSGLRATRSKSTVSLTKSGRSISMPLSKRLNIASSRISLKPKFQYLGKSIPFQAITNGRFSVNTGSQKFLL